MINGYVYYIIISYQIISNICMSQVNKAYEYGWPAEIILFCLVVEPLALPKNHRSIFSQQVSWWRFMRERPSGKMGALWGRSEVNKILWGNHCRISAHRAQGIIGWWLVCKASQHGSTLWPNRCKPEVLDVWHKIVTSSEHHIQSSLFPKPIFVYMGFAGNIRRYTLMLFEHWH